MKHITVKDRDTIFSNNDLSERFSAVIMQHYFVEAVAVAMNDGRDCCIVHINKFNDDDECIYNLTDFHEDYSFVDAVCIDVTNGNGFSFKTVADAVDYLVTLHITGFDLIA